MKGENEPRKKSPEEELLERYMKEHANEVEENYIKQKTRNIDVDVNAIVVQRQQQLLYEQKLKELKEKEKAKWETLKNDSKNYRCMIKII